MKIKISRALSRCWMFFLPAYFIAAGLLDPSEVTNGEYLKFILATRHAAPENWSHGRVLAGSRNDPVVLVTFYDAAVYCRWVRQNTSACQPHRVDI